VLVIVAVTIDALTCCFQHLDTDPYSSIASPYVVGQYPFRSVFASIVQLLSINQIKAFASLGNTTFMANTTMPGKLKRKWRWSSKSPFASVAPNKTAKRDHSVLHTQDGAADLNFTTDMSLDGCSTEDSQQRSGVAARMRRNGSKLLSIVGIQRGDEQILPVNVCKFNKC